MTWRLVQLVRQPADDYLNALGLFLSGWRWSRAPILALAAVLTWWIYVPLHELAHAFGCMLGGGTVSRLDIDPLYGAALLQRVFPFVAVGSDYAGQLTGFDTRGSDLTYLLTDFLPFIATIIVGVPLLQAVGRPGWSSAAQAALFGASLPIAFAPFVSITGDYYEMGSIIVSRLVRAIDPSFVVTRWRSDDLLRLGGQLFADQGNGTIGDAVGLTAAFLVGCALAVLTYAAGTSFARVISSPRAESAAPANRVGPPARSGSVQHSTSD